MQSVKYILKKDLPDSEAGDIYIWNDSQKAYYKHGNVLGSYWTKEHVENNPEWFEPIPSPPTTIDTICNEVGKMINEQQSNYIISVYLKNEISKLKPQDTFTWTDGRVKEFVKYYNDLDGFVFGADPIGETIQSWKQSKSSIPKEETSCVFNEEKINQRIDVLNEIRVAEEKAFNAAREIWADEFKVPECQNKYKDFHEYKSKQYDQWYRHVVDSSKPLSPNHQIQ